MIEDEHLDEDARKAIASGEVISREVRDQNGQLFIRTVEPYRSQIGGVITAYKPVQSEEDRTRSDFLMRELDHRVKNMLAIILSIAEISARSNTDIDTYKNDFRARLESMARTHNLLAGSQWTRLNLRDLVEEELFSIAPRDNVVIEGPDIAISPAAAQSLAMLLHELVANAAKYGALTNDQGRAVIRWEIEGEGRAKLLRLTWHEAGGPPVTKPQRDGFGGKVINRIVKRQLNAQVETLWDVEGIKLTAHIPLEAISASSA